MKSRESNELLESLDKITQSLIIKVQRTEVKVPILPKVADEIESENKLDLTKLIIGALGTASLGFGIAYLTNGDKTLYSIIGAAAGVGSAYLSQKKKNESSISRVTSKMPENHDTYRKEVLSVIREVNEEIRQSWEMEMKQLTEKQRNSIALMSWSDEQKQQAIDKTLIYKSIIIADYNYTDAIEDLNIDDKLRENINVLFGKWKEGIINTINKTKEDQWNSFFSKIY